MHKCSKQNNHMIICVDYKVKGILHSVLINSDISKYGIYNNSFKINDKVSVAIANMHVVLLYNYPVSDCTMIPLIRKISSAVHFDKLKK